MITQIISTPRYPEPYLEYWADRYVELDLAAQGVPLLAFLADPHGHLHLGERPRPLLPAQEAVAERVEALDDEAERQLQGEHPDTQLRGRALREPLHHHAHIPRSSRAHFRGKGGAS